MKRKYLDDIGAKPIIDKIPKTDKRHKRWEKQRKKYGFDETETYNLDYTFCMWLYERLNMYLKVADRIIDLDFHKISIDKKTQTLKEWIKELIEKCKAVLQATDTRDEAITEIANVWAEIVGYMWW